ncbi:TPA: prepilin-type N-terminal cleavage/methylation domain-containing protein [Aeromonas hydrophila]
MKKQSGFTLIELMIVVAIVAILAAIALPAYQTYTKKAKFTEVVAATGAAKTAIEVCSQSGSTPTACVTAATTAVSGSVGTAIVDKVEVQATNSTQGSAVYEVKATGLAPVAETYYIIGTEDAGRVKWEANPSGSVGSCVAAGIC